MKLLQMIENQLVYGAPEHSPQLLDLTLKEIVNAGKVTNAYQLFALGRVAMFFKNGLKSIDMQLRAPVNFESGETSSELKAHLQSLSDVEHVQLAQYLLNCIIAGESALHDTSAEPIDWMNYVLQRQR